ncbi:MAG: hypothetical protein PWP23_2910 [Candidatus Sumerlaeota bacterium]|nr:hypothetical protein [Candidatus Sumerlaeota bacterium]
MKLNAKSCTIIAALAVFIGLPLLIYALGDFPRRSVLKETISILTLLFFSLMLAQFFMARSNEPLLKLFKPKQIQNVHKVISYTAVGFILLHPFFIVLPRYFEGGVKPLDAFVTMITTFDSLGILLGIGAWVLLLLMTITAIFRIGLIKRLQVKYPVWRYFHGGLAVVFVILAVWHAIELGRHTDTAMSVYFITLPVIGVALLGRYYWRTIPHKTAKAPAIQGAKS